MFHQSVGLEEQSQAAVGHRPRDLAAARARTVIDAAGIDAVAVILHGDHHVVPLGECREPDEPAPGFSLFAPCLRCADAVIGASLGPRLPSAQGQARVLEWGDQGDGTYRNPILKADYSDPDVIRVGDDYYL